MSSGSHGIVSFLTIDGKQCAIKKFFKKGDYKQEKETLTCLQNLPGISILVGSDDRNNWIYTEKALCDFEEWLNELIEPIDPWCFIDIVKSFLIILSSLQIKQLVHRDIRPCNIL